VVVAHLFEAVCRRLRSAVAIMAALELRSGSARVRTLVLAATGAVAAFAAVSIAGASADLQRGLDGIAADVDRSADVWVAFRGPTDIFGTTPIAIPPQRLRRIEKLDGVRAVTRNRGSFLDLGEERVWVLAPARPRVGPVLRRQVEEGDPRVAVRRLRRGGWVALSQGLATDLGVDVGERVDLPLPAPARLRVAAVTNNFGWPGGAIAMSAATYARAWGSRTFSTLGIRLAPGTEPARVAAAVHSILGRGSGLSVEATATRTGRQRATSRAGLARLSQIAALILLSSALAMAASMAALVWQRRPSFAALKVHGFGEGELWRALLLEGAVLLGAGCFLGVAFGLIGQLLLDRALETITGFPVIYELAAPAALRILILLAGTAVGILALPGWLAVRVSPQADVAK
jgi:putative ABC transport system permease protein